MKKLIILFVLALLVSCRVKKLNTHQETQEKELIERLFLKEEATEQTTLSQHDFEQQARVLSELATNLQLGFAGKNQDDKLLFELKKTVEGLKFEVSGNGTANYQQAEQIDMEKIQQETYKHQDSLFNLQINYIKSFEEKLLKELRTKDKEVKVTGFQFGAYVWLGIVLIVGIFLYLILKRFKLI